MNKKAMSTTSMIVALILALLVILLGFQIYRHSGGLVGGIVQQGNDTVSSIGSGVIITPENERAYPVSFIYDELDSYYPKDYV